MVHLLIFLVYHSCVGILGIKMVKEGLSLRESIKNVLKKAKVVNKIGNASLKRKTW